MHHAWKQWSFLLMWSQVIFSNGPLFRFRWNANLQILLEDIQPASPKLKTYSSSHNNGNGKWVPTRLSSIAMVMGERVRVSPGTLKSIQKVSCKPSFIFGEVRHVNIWPRGIKSGFVPMLLGAPKILVDYMIVQTSQTCRYEFPSACERDPKVLNETCDILKWTKGRPSSIQSSDWRTIEKATLKHTKWTQSQAIKVCLEE